MPSISDDVAATPSPITSFRPGAGTAPTTSKPKRVRKPAELTGPVHPREMTKIRDEVGRIRDEAIASGESVSDALVKLYATVDRLDLRFRIHHDSSTLPKKV